jgi:hypothetical protein
MIRWATLEGINGIRPGEAQSGWLGKPGVYGLIKFH